MRELAGPGRRGTRARRAAVRAGPAATWTPAARLLSNSSPGAGGGTAGGAAPRKDPAWAGEPSEVARLVHEHKAPAPNPPRRRGSPALETQALNYMGSSCRSRKAGLLIPSASFLLPAKRKGGGRKKEKKRKRKKKETPNKNQNPGIACTESQLRLRSQALDALGASFS